MFNLTSYLRKRLLLIATPVCVLSITPSMANSDTPVFDESNYECAFEITTAKPSILRFSFNEQAYHCLQDANYQDIAVVDASGNLMPFQRVHGGDIEVDKTSKQHSFYPEESAPEVKTADQVRRISQLTGLRAGGETNKQWQLKNAFYSSFIISRSGNEEGRENLGQLKQLNLEIKTASTQAVNAVVMIEQSDDLQNWRTLVNRYDAYLLPQNGTSNDEPSGKTMTLSVPIKYYSLSPKNKYLRMAVLSNVTDFSDLLLDVKADYHKTRTVLPEQQWTRLVLEKVENSQDSGSQDDNRWLANTESLAPINKIRFTPSQKTAIYQGRVRSKRYQSPFLSKEKRVDGRDKVKNILQDVVVGKPKQTVDKSWRRASNFSLYQLQTESGQVSHMLQTLAERQSHEWEFEFSNPESFTQNKLPVIEFGWRPVQFDFVAQGVGPYRLLVGGHVRTNRLNYPAQLSQLVGRTKTVSLLAMNKQEPETEIEPQENTSSTVAWGKVMLWVILALGVLLMLNMVRQLSKKIAASSEDET